MLQVIEWSIKNVSSCSVLDGERLECPVITAGNLFGTVWVLLIYPRGEPDSDPNYLGCYLKRGEDEVGPEKLKIEFEISLLTFEGIKTFTRSKKVEFQRGACFGFADFAKLEEIFSRKELLHDDTLKFRCEFRLVPRKKQTSLKTIVSSFPTKKITKSMHLDNFQKTSTDKPMVLIIEEASEKELLLNVSMNKYRIFEEPMIAGGGKDDAFPESYLHMVMIKKKWDQPLHVSCCIEVLTKKLEIATKRETRHLFTKIMEIEDWVLPHFIDTNTLGDDCIDNGSLHLHFTFTICDKQPVTISSADVTPWKLQDEPNQNTLMKEMLDLYQTNKFSDVTLRVGDEEFQAHRTVLAARSPKFAEIFKNLMKEGANCENSIIEIEDVDKDTMERMLKFIYADELDDLDDEGILQLYTAAQKYRISSLRFMCVGNFRKNLTLQTVYKVLVVVEKFQDSELKLVAQEHIEKHCEYVLLSPEWQSFMEEHKGLYDEVVNYLRMKKQ